MRIDTEQEQVRRLRRDSRAVSRMLQLPPTHGTRHCRRLFALRAWMQRENATLLGRSDHGRIDTIGRSISVVVLLVAGMWGAQEDSKADNEWQPTSYEQRFETPKNGVRLEDNNVWVYTSTFAERFGMPKRWISDKLEGAEAVAYRVETQNVRYCGYFGEPDNCRTDYLCTFDLYLSDKDSRKLPWKTDRAVEFAKEDTSVPFLSAQSRNDQKGWIEEEQRYDRSRLNIGLDSISWVGGPQKGEKVYSESSDGVRVMAYDRELFEGVDYIEFALDCGIANAKNKVRLFFSHEFPVRSDFNVSYQEVVEESTKDARDFLKVKRKWARNFKSGSVIHIVRLPDSYMNRVTEYDSRTRVPESLATEVERRVRAAE